MTTNHTTNIILKPLFKVLYPLVNQKNLLFLNPFYRYLINNLKKSQENLRKKYLIILKLKSNIYIYIYITRPYKIYT